MAQRTPLFEEHQALGARLINFNGWEMPVQYPAGIIAEHIAVREKAGIFDTCHMGEFYLSSSDIRVTLNKMLPGDFSNLKAGRMRYTFITASNGTVIDDAVVFLFSDTDALICVNAGDIPGDFNYLNGLLPDGASIEERSAITGKLDIQGPNAHEVVKKLFELDFRKMPFYSFRMIRWNGLRVLLSRSGYTGSPGVELFLDSGSVKDLWKASLEAGEEFGMLPCGLGARDTLRLEAGLPLYGHELNREVNPLQAGFDRFVSLKKAESFPGRNALMKYSAENAQALIGLRLDDKRTPREGFEVKASGQVVGKVTSGGPGLYVGGTLALAYVDQAVSQPGTPLQVDIRGKEVNADVVELPFYKSDELRKIHS